MKKKKKNQQANKYFHMAQKMLWSYSWMKDTSKGKTDLNVTSMKSWRNYHLSSLQNKILWVSEKNIHNYLKK